jgi:hypothetical protein
MFKIIRPSCFAILFEKKLAARFLRRDETACDDMLREGAKAIRVARCNGNRPMDNKPITARRYTDFAEMKADEYRYWQSRPAHERLDAVEEMIETAYALKGWEIEPDVPRLQRPFVRLPCPWR